MSVTANNVEVINFTAVRSCYTIAPHVNVNLVMALVLAIDVLSMAV